MFKIDYRSLFLGLFLGATSLFIILFLLGSVETAFTISTGQELNNMNQDIDIRIEKIIENKKDLTKVIAIGRGDVAISDLERQIEEVFKKNNINPDDKNINIEMKIIN